MRIALGNQLSPTQNLMGNGAQASARNFEGDPNFASLVFGCHFDGTTTTFTDIKGHTMTGAGNATQNSSVAKWGNAVQLDGSGDFVTVTASSDFSFTGDFAFMGWILRASGTGDDTFMAMNLGGSYLAFNWNGTTNFNVYLNAGSASASGGTPPAAGNWVFYELNRNGSTVRVFQNGTEIINTTKTGTLGSAVVNLEIGGGAIFNDFPGTMDDWRIYKGWGGNTSNYTPPTAPFLDS